MNMLRPLGDEVLRLPGDFEHLARAGIDLPGDEKGMSCSVTFQNPHPVA